MKKDDEFSFTQEEIPTIKRRSEGTAPVRRSIGSVSEDGLIVPSPVKRRNIPLNNTDETERRQIQRPKDNIQPPRPARQSVQEVQRSVRQTPADESPRTPVREAPIQRPVRETAAQRQARQRPVKPEPPAKTAASIGQRVRTERTADNAAVNRRHTAQEAPRPEAMRTGCGIMPPMALKHPSRYELPAKIEKGMAPPELRQRHELKFYLNYTDYVILRQKMKGLLRLDPNAKNGGYLIRSLYFDNVYNSAVSEKESGVQFRHKYRIRIYNCDKSVIKFEKKVKTGDFISKDSFSMTYREFCMLRDSDIEFLLHKKEALAKEVYLQMRQNLLKPCVVVDYYREPFVMNYETIRITFDSDIRTGEPSWDLFDPALPLMPLLDKGTVVMEVKFAKALPDYIQNVINSASGMQRSAVSKYIICRQYD